MTPDEVNGALTCLNNHLYRQTADACTYGPSDEAIMEETVKALRVEAGLQPHEAYDADLEELEKLVDRKVMEYIGHGGLDQHGKLRVLSGCKCPRHDGTPLEVAD